MTLQLVTKGQFAAMINVSAGRVSQMIAAGQISQAALVGAGQRAKINVEQAKTDLRMALDVGQRMGNGINTRLDDGDGAADSVEAPAPGAQRQDAAPARESGIDYQIKQEKLEQVRRANRNAAIAEARERGQLVETAAAKAEMVKVASSMLQVFEGALADFAGAVSAQFEVPQRDVLHLMRREMKKVRAAASRQMAALGEQETETVQTTVDADELDTVN
ncbi:hypothetical protein HDIA_1977 [Hartmannibacter diazotrophicus]|uniref:Uncharacterized protein n=1 Tax=Hartmannibacter diazotrophicus TaxID=1482074 RepID=A0A2C9D5V0_9HYPH|nr:hypothetical protein [Hartmannibacter diazotrophicus]SON55518.1 hypothetical protein HDIA_1977 [Hartmannibacter diazotrophicus]